MFVQTQVVDFWAEVVGTVVALLLVKQAVAKVLQWERSAKGLQWERTWRGLSLATQHQKCNNTYGNGNENGNGNSGGLSAG